MLKLGELRSCPKICYSELQNKSFRDELLLLWNLRWRNQKAANHSPSFQTWIFTALKSEEEEGAGGIFKAYIQLAASDGCCW